MTSEPANSDLEGVILDTLAEIEEVSCNVYPAEALKNATAPFVFYAMHADGEEYTLDGFTGLLSGGFYIHCVAQTYAQLVALCGAVRAKLQALQGTTINGLLIEKVRVHLASPDIKEKEVDLYRRMYNLQINYQEV